jgi:hypothetical protein
MPANSKNAPSQKAAPVKASAPHDAAAAFAAVEAEVLQLDASHMVAINLDIPTAVSVVLGALPAVRPLRGDIVTQLPKFPLAYLDNLETYALAAWYAHLVALPAAAGSKQVKDLVEEAMPLRAALLSDADALARRGLVSSETVTDIRAGQGHIDTANDLVALSALFSSSWAEIQGKTAATMAEVQQAALLGPQLLAALGVRDQSRVSPGEASERRARAFSLLVRAYDATRRAVSYLRWDEDDADSLTPSLYKGRGGRPSSDSSVSKVADAPADTTHGSPAAAPAPAGGASGSSPA